MKRIFLQQYFYRRIMRIKRIILFTKRNSQNSFNSPFYLSRFKSFLSFFCASEKLTHFVLSNQKISLFLPSPFRDKSIWSEKAHSSLCSSEVNLDNFRLDSDLKNRFDTLCEGFGMSASTAFNIFVRAVVRQRWIPFEIEMPEEEKMMEIVRRNPEE